MQIAIAGLLNTFNTQYTTLLARQQLCAPWAGKCFGFKAFNFKTEERNQGSLRHLSSCNKRESTKAYLPYCSQNFSCVSCPANFHLIGNCFCPYFAMFILIFFKLEETTGTPLVEGCESCESMRTLNTFVGTLYRLSILTAYLIQASSRY